MQYLLSFLDPITRVTSVNWRHSDSASSATVNLHAVPFLPTLVEPKGRFGILDTIF
jgi:hypothetical protein